MRTFLLPQFLCGSILGWEETAVTQKQNPRKKGPAEGVREKSASRKKPVETGKPTSFPIVGVGGSAGGMAAFSRLLKALPPKTGMAFVLVQHLDPKHVSILAEILARETQMPVAQVENGMLVEPDHVYVIPPDFNMALFHGHLTLIKRQRGIHAPIDYFFHSLAQEKKDKAVGIILSGTGTDGSLGLKEIRAENGITFAQDVETAEYGGMPSSAISTDAADFVGSPEKMASMLVKMSRHPHLRRGPEAAVESLSSKTKEDLLGRIFLLLRNMTGVDFTYYKRSTVERRLARRMLLLKIDKLEDYAGLLESDASEIEQLFQDILIHVTSFFREPEVFEILKTKIFPAIMEHKQPATPVRIWVPGCATGEEAYSLAIAFSEFSEARSNRPEGLIFATDLNEKAIESARSGIYAEGSMADISEERRNKYFVAQESGYQVNKFVRQMCVFARHDVLKDPPFSRMDLISFRNVLIYMAPVLQQKVLPMLHYALEPWGFLLLGTSESIGGFPDLFRTVDKKQKIYAKKPVSGRLMLPLEVQPPAIALETETSRLTGTGGKKKTELRFDPQTQASSILMSKYAPSAVLINDEMDIIQFWGKTGRFLEPAPGRASLSLPAMAREGLMLEIRSAVHEARKTGTEINKDGLKIDINGGSIDVGMTVFPFKSPGGENYFLVTFAELSPGAAPKTRGAPARRDVVDRLRQELQSTNSYLQSMIEEKEESNEELRAANEEIQSSNEELQSINEELETAKEELQSTNEELTTVNDELQNRNQELIEVSDDLENMHNSADIPMVILSEDAKIRRFTPVAERILNVIPSDVGRPISDISLNVEVSDIEELARSVIRSLSPVQEEVRDKTGRWYSMQIRPFKTSGNRIQGVVLTFIDITALRSSLEALKTSAVLNDTMAQINMEINTSLNTNEIMAKTLKLGMQAIGADAAFLSQRQNDHWVIAQATGMFKDLVGQEFSEKEFAVSILAEGTKKPVAVDDAYNDKRVNTAMVKRLGVRSILAIPLMVRGEKSFGAVEFCFVSKPVSFHEESIRFAERMAAAVSLALENARLFQCEHNIAETLQEALLPNPPSFPGVEYDYEYRSATEAARVGGDFYDIFEVGKGRIGIAIGDVSGKGVEAASLSALAEHTLKAYASQGDPPEVAMKKTNEVLRNNIGMANFVTMFFGVLDSAEGLLTYCNAGHPPAILRKKTGTVKRLTSASPIVGAFDDVDFKSGQAQLKSGDILVLYTDGVIEARRDSELFGEHRLLNTIKQKKAPKHRSKAPREMSGHIFSELTKFSGGQLADDVALLVVGLVD